MCSLSPTAEGVDVSKFDAVIAAIGETRMPKVFWRYPGCANPATSQRQSEDLAECKAVAGKGKPVVTVYACWSRFGMPMI